MNISILEESSGHNKVTAIVNARLMIFMAVSSQFCLCLLNDIYTNSKNKNVEIHFFWKIIILYQLG